MTKSRIVGPKKKRCGNSRGRGKYGEAPLEWKILGGGGQTGKKNLAGGMDIFQNHTLSVLNVLLCKF